MDKTKKQSSYVWIHSVPVLLNIFVCLSFKPTLFIKTGNGLNPVADTQLIEND